ncbi:reverse transcriptase domain-containing protein, partial [Tanacetum coccineum]
AAYFTANNDVGSSPNNAFSKPDPHAHDKTSPPGPFDGDKVIPKNQVVVVVSESDTRNTTQPPQYLHKDGYTKNGKQPELENHVGVGGYGYPAFIPLNIKNGAYALLKRDTFTDGSVKCTMTSMTASEPVVSLAVSPFSKDSGNKYVFPPTLRAFSDWWVRLLLEEILWDKKYDMDLYRCKDVLSIFNLVEIHSVQFFLFMRTRSQSRRRRQQQTLPVVENFEPIVDQNIVAMADNRTMAQMLQAPIEGYEDAIVVPPINANNFELKQPLINLVQSNKFTGRQDPHNHLRFFNKVTSTFRHPEVPNTSVKLLLFPFSLDGEARDWLDKEPPRSILTWDDLVSKFINQFFPPSKTTYLRNKITNFFQELNKTFNEAWERFKGLLRQCPHHGFSELHQLDTFYNSLNSNDQDALDSTAGGNFLDKMPQEGLVIIESKSKVRYSRSRANDSRVSTDAPLSNSSPSNNSFDIQQIAASLEDKMTYKC